MTSYAILLTGDENKWESLSAEEQAEVFGRHERFSSALAERGHTVTGGAQLDSSRSTKRVGLDAAGSVVITDGPYAESAEQLGAFYLVDTDDLDDLLKICGILAEAEGAIEVRKILDEDSEG